MKNNFKAVLKITIISFSSEEGKRFGHSKKQFLEPFLSSYLIVIMVLLGLTGCASVKGYQKMYLSDKDMILKEKAIESFEINAESYREGTSGANGINSGGGCGCN